MEDTNRSLSQLECFIERFNQYVFTYNLNIAFIDGFIEVYPPANFADKRDRGWSDEWVRERTDEWVPNWSTILNSLSRDISNSGSIIENTLPRILAMQSTIDNPDNIF